MSGIFRDLLHRRVPQIVGVYLGVGWAAIEFADWLVNRYVLSPHLIDFTLVAWVSLIPTVLLLAYHRGLPGATPWTAVEKIGVPVNVALSATLLLLLFGAKDLGSATKSVTVEDEAGDTIARVVPKNEFRKSVALFFLDNESGDTALDWLQYAVPLALEFDLSQDLFLTLRSTAYLRQRLREEGLQDGLRVPLTLKRKLAEELHLEYFQAGSLSKSGAETVISIELYDTNRGKLLERRSYQGSDILELGDRISLQLKRDMGLPSAHIESAKDLPLAETLSLDLQAFRAASDGWYAALMHDDWRGAEIHLERAVSIDPSFAFASVLLYAVRTSLNELQQAQAALLAAMEHDHKLPESLQFGLKTEYYWVVKQDIEKAMAVAGMHAELFPSDVQAHERLAIFHQLTDEKDKAIADLERVLDLDPSRYDNLRQIGTLYRQKGEYDAALKYYERYADRFPNDHRSFTALGSLERVRGNHEQARQHYERALVVELDNVPALRALAQIAADLGDFERAETGFREALDASKTGEQRAQALDALRVFYERRGQSRLAIEATHRKWAELQQWAPPLSAIQIRLNDLDTYVRAGQTDVALDSAQSLAGVLSSPWDALASIGYLRIYLELEDADKLEEARRGVDTLIETFGFRVLRPLSVYANGRILELRDHCDQALIAYKRALELYPTAVEWNTDVARCYRALGDHSRAKEAVQNALRVIPYEPDALMELARIEAALGNSDAARQQLGKVLEVWRDADPRFRPAREAQELLTELKADV